MANKIKKSLRDIVREHTFKVLCNGRDDKQRPALGLAGDDLVTAEVTVRLHALGQMLTLDVNCPHICGSHGGECNASGNSCGTSGPKGICPYSIDLPYAIDERYKRE